MWSFGVLLCQLLSGEPPYNPKMFMQALLFGVASGKITPRRSVPY